MSVQIAMWQTMFSVQLSVLQASLGRLLMAVQGTPKKVSSEGGEKGASKIPAEGGPKKTPGEGGGEKGASKIPAEGGPKKTPGEGGGEKGASKIPAEGGPKKVSDAGGGMGMPKGVPVEGERRGFPTWAIVLIVVAVLFCLLPTCIIAILMLLGSQINEIFSNIVQGLETP